MPASRSRLRAHRSSDPLESAIETALDPGRFVSERAGFAFVSDLDAVARDLARLVESDPQRAAALYLTFLAGCHGHLSDGSPCSVVRSKGADEHVR